MSSYNFQVPVWCVCAQLLSHVQLLVTLLPLIKENQTSQVNELITFLCMGRCKSIGSCILSLPGFSVYGILQARILEQGCHFPSGDLPDPGIEATSPALAGRLLPLSYLRSPHWTIVTFRCFLGSAVKTAAAAKSLQSWPTLCDPIDSSPTGSPVPGVLQARTLEWVSISFSNAWKWKVNVKSLSHVRLLATPWIAAYQAPLSMGFARQQYWSGVSLPSPTVKTTFYQLSTFPIGLSGFWC